MTDSATSALSLEETRHVAKLARLQLSEEELESCRHDLTAILDHVATLGELDLQGVLNENQKLAEVLHGSPLSWEDPVQDLALQNIQARVRGVQIWMLANLRQALLLTTSNKSEAAVGYTTMDGDTSGGLAPIADVPKSLVTTWLAWARDFHNSNIFRCPDTYAG